MTTTTQPAELTDEQRKSFEDIAHAIAGHYSNASVALLGAVEKSTGQTRGVICIVADVADDPESVDYIPVAVLLDDPNAVDLFELPEGATVHGPNEV